MPNRPPTYKPPRPAQPQAAPTPRPSAAERGYGSRWQRYRLAFLAEHPLCERCQDAGLVVEATVVDHRIPHKGNETLFWQADNHSPLCKPCHDKKTVAEDGGLGRPVLKRENV